VGLGETDGLAIEVLFDFLFAISRRNLSATNASTDPYFMKRLVESLMKLLPITMTANASRTFVNNSTEL